MDCEAPPTPRAARALSITSSLPLPVCEAALLAAGGSMSDAALALIAAHGPFVRDKEGARGRAF